MDRWLQSLGISFNQPLHFGGEPADYFTVPRGQLTFDAEGIEHPGSFYHSRTAHIPSNSSGITLGRGFDLSRNSKETIRAFLEQSKFEQSYINLALGAAGLRGSSARQYLKANSFPEIAAQQQYDLFNLSFAAMEQDIRRIIAKPETVAAYGELNWNLLPSPIKELVVDLRYRGDYTPETRLELQPLLVNNDIGGIKALINDRIYWIQEMNVPPARFKVRADFVNKW